MVNSIVLRLALTVALVLTGQAAIAAGGGANEMPPIGSPPEDPNFTLGRKAVEAQNWQAATEAFSKVVAKDPRNADGFNMLAYSYRKSGNLDMAFKNYDEALRIDPKHRAAHEYLGEAYLMAGNLAKAEEHLNTLDKLCFFGCDEFRELKKAVADYKQKAASK